MNKKKLLAAGLAIVVPGLALAGSGTISVTQGTGTTYQTTTTAGGANLANVVSCDASAGAHCQTVDASGEASVVDAGLNLAQASTTSGQTGTLVQGATTTGAPTYTTAKTNPLSLDTSGNLRVVNPAGFATSANQSTEITDLGTINTSIGTVNTTLGTPMQATGGTVGIVAGTAAIGQVGGFDSGPVVAVSTPANSSHAAGQSIGGLFTLAVARTNGGSGAVTQFAFKSVGASVGAYVVRIWDKNPAGTTCTDNSAFVGSDTDDAFLITPPFGFTPIAPQVTTGDSATYAAVTNQWWDYKNADTSPGTSLYVCVITVATNTADDNHQVRVTLSGPQN